VLHNSTKKDRKSLAAVIRKKVRASGSPACSVRYYSLRAGWSSIITLGSAVKIRKESTIVLKDEVGYVGLQRAAELLGMNHSAPYATWCPGDSWRLRGRARARRRGSWSPWPP
jgi:hypothetical protein